jgi:hypothetical protein
MLLLLRSLLEGGVTATASIAEDNDTATAVAGVALSATLARPDAGDTIVSSAKILVSATGTGSEAGDTVSAAGTVVFPPVTGTLAGTDAADTGAGQASVLVGASLAYTDIGDTLASLGVVQSPVVVSAGRANLIYEIALLHGLVPGNPLTVSATGRSAGNVVQTISGTDTVTITTVASDVLQGDLSDWIDALAAIHGLTVPLVTTDITRVAGTVSQTLATDGITTTVDLV